MMGLIVNFENLFVLDKTYVVEPPENHTERALRRGHIIDIYGGVAKLSQNYC